MTCYWGLLGAETVESTKRTRTLGLGAAVRAFNDLAVPGIGRVDRVGSHWENTLVRESQANEKSEHFSRIEIRPVVFRGTYDEHNWKILQQRWHDLRAQLHGIVITASTEELRDTDLKTIFDDITANTPNFSPSCHELAK